MYIFIISTSKETLLNSYGDNSEELKKNLSEYNTEIINEEGEFKLYIKRFTDSLSSKRENIMFLRGDSYINNLNDFDDIITKSIEKNIDILYLNKNKDRCENHIRIDSEFRYSSNPNSLQCVMFNKKAMEYIIKNYNINYNFQDFLNNIAHTCEINNLKSVVSTRNIVEYDINLSRNLKDHEKIIQCDSSYNEVENFICNNVLLIVFLLLVLIVFLLVYCFHLSRKNISAS